jgi:hypothetical protein
MEMEGEAKRGTHRSIQTERDKIREVTLAELHNAKATDI